MPIDVNIKCVKQKTEEIDISDNVFILESLNCRQTKEAVYTDNWYVYNAVIGRGYHVYLREDREATYRFVDFAEISEAAPYMKYMLQDNKNPSHGTYQRLNDCILFQERYLSAFENLLRAVLRESTVNTCIVFFRLQTPCPERYVGRIGLTQFMSLLKDKQVYLNTAYIISEAEYD